MKKKHLKGIMTEFSNSNVYFNDSKTVFGFLRIGILQQKKKLVYVKKEVYNLIHLK